METLTASQQATLRELEQRTKQYSGEVYSSLTLPSKIFTSLSWRGGYYHTKSFTDFYEVLQKIDFDLASVAAKSGINYHVLASGDSDPYSGYVYPEMGVTTGQWDLYMSRSMPGKEWRELTEQIDFSELSLTLKAFEEGIIREVVADLEAFGLTVDEVMWFAA